LHAIESSDDEIVVVWMNGIASLDGLITVQQIVEQTLRTRSENLFRQNFEVAEGPEQNDALGEG